MLVALTCAVSCNLPSREGEAQGAHEFREVHLGMETRIVVVHATEAEAVALARGAFDEIARLEGILSDWRPASEVRMLERADAGTWIPISEPLRDVLALALRVARATDGAFDPTVGPLTALWREARRTGQPIDKEERAAARSRVGFALVSLDSAGRAVRFARVGMRLDLGAVAKGWILDRAIEHLEASGVRSALIEAGGDLVVRGSPPGEAGWRIDVPRARGDTIIVLTGGALGTSGSSAQRIDATAGSESHVIDPQTGRGLATGGDLTVIGPHAAITDALATALSLVPADRRPRLAATFGVTIIAP